VLSLKTEGFAQLISEVSSKARLASDAAKILRIALTLDDRLGEDVGLGAVTAADRIVVDLLRRSAVPLDLDAEAGDLVVLTRTGRLAISRAEATAQADAHLLGALRWDGERAADIRRRWRAEHEKTREEISRIHRDLAREPVDRVDAKIARIQHSIVHMAPVLIYVDDRTYTNLGKSGNLPGKSLSVDNERSLLVQLRDRPVIEWDPEDACFVACLDALLLSGPAVRAEEFNGAQLNPTTLARFLAERIASYGGTVPARGREAPDLRHLEESAIACSEGRRKAVSAGRLPYRVINGLNLHKRERLMSAPTLLADAPERVASYTRELLGVDLPATQRIDGLGPLFSDLAGRLVHAPAPGPFSTAFEGVLHGFLTAAAEAFDADVAMSRGPETFDPLRAEPGSDADPFALGTGDFFCCVTPRQAFVQRFGGDRQGLVRALSAYSARMRFNTWHYLPHTLAIAEREPGREDWFFAPTMPDVTEWSDQHHTGHVTFGVRYAIRVPFGIRYDGRALPGLYDLRLMRTSPPPFTTEELRRAIAAAAILGQLYQAMSVHEPVVTDFGKDWYQRFHG
jgi:hypothetical protein